MNKWVPGWLLIWLIWLGCWAWPAACANSPGDFPFAEPYFEAVGDADTIPEGSITAIAQDGQGFLWIGTQQGLIRFDGYQFKKFVHDVNNPASIAGNYVTCLWVGPDQRIWIGTSSDGVSVFDPARAQFFNYRHHKDQANSLSPGMVNAIVGDRQGAIWVGTENGLDYLAPGLRSFRHFRHDAQQANSLLDNRVRTLLLDQQQQLWVGGASGLQKFNRERQSFSAIAAAPNYDLSQVGNSLDGTSVTSLFQAKDGKIWVGSKNLGLSWLQAPSWQLHRSTLGNHSSPASITSIVQPQPDQLWLGTVGEGVQIVRASDGSLLKNLRHDPAIASSLALDDVPRMLVDQAGLLWLGTSGNGLQRYNTQNHSFRTLRYSPAKPNSISHANVSAILERADGSILVANAANGIDILQRQRGLVAAYLRAGRSLPRPPGAAALAAQPMLPTDRIACMLETPDGTLWLGSGSSGALRLGKNDARWQSFGTAQGMPDNHVLTLLRSRDGSLWAGTRRGLARWDEAHRRFQAITMDEAMLVSLHALAEDADGHIFASSHQGLWVYDPKQPRWWHLVHEPKRASSLIADRVNGLLLDKDGRLWLDTVQGLERMRTFHGNKTEFEHISVLLKRPGISVGENLLQDQQGRIWTEGIVIDPQKLRYVELTKADGIDIGGVWFGAGTKTRDGLMLIGGPKGLAIINPAQFQPWDFHPPVRASELKLGGISHALGKLDPMLKLPPETRNFSIEFAALDYSMPQSSHYAYRLQGYDQDWISTDAAHRNASYGNLWPGSYTLQVRATNRIGEWSRHELSIPILVLPAFWQTGWFLIAAIVLLGSSIILVHQWRNRRLRAEATVLQKKVDARTKDILKLGEIGRELTATLDIEQAFERTYQRVSARLDAFVFRIGIYEPEAAQIRFVYEMENAQRQATSVIHMDERERPAVWCVREQRELIIGNNSELLNYVSTILPPSQGAAMETVVYLPLRLQNQVIGCLSVQSPKPNAYRKDQLEFLRVLANYIAIAIANAEAHGELAATLQHLQETQGKLIQSEKMAALGSMMAGIAHEINTPLGTALVALSGAAKSWEQVVAAISSGRVSKSQLSSDTHNGIEFTALAMDTASRAAKLIKTMQSIAIKVETDNELEVNLENYLQEVANLVRLPLEQAHCQISVDAPADLRLRLVAEALTEALAKILENCVDHAFGWYAPGDALVANGETGRRVSLRAVAGLDGHITIEVQDNGHGIPLDALPRVFDPFFTTCGGNQGHLGLGLHIAYTQITQRLKGEIAIVSEIGVGTVVRIRLPLNQARTVT